MQEYVATLIAGIIGAVATLFATAWGLTANNRKSLQLKGTRNLLESKNDELSQKEQELEKIKQDLQKHTLSFNYSQQVLLCGPKSVGKTSLATRLHSPWKREELSPTLGYRKLDIPVIRLEEKEMKPHTSCPSIYVKQEKFISLLLYDFSGEIQSQEQIIKVLSSPENKKHGVVLVLMFEASELDNISRETRSYYNGDLFKRLKNLQAHHVNIVRIILVFNKFDLLCEKYPDKSIIDLTKECAKRFTELIDPIYDAVSPEKICEIATILESTNKHGNVMGDSTVKGEMAREIVFEIGGVEAVKSVVRQGASNFASIRYSQQEQ
jgi:GTPase SAR1 family protein